MKVISSILGRVYVVYFLLLFIVTMFIVLPVIWIVYPLSEPLRTKIIHKIFRVWMGVFLPMVFCPVRRKGKQNFKDGQQYVVVLNHNSMMDIPVATPWIPGPNKTLAKIEMSKVPFFGVIYKCGSILVDRKKESSRRESITKMQENLDMGLHLCLYPEGTRNKSGQPMQPFFDGAFITAIKAQKPIMPGVIFNTGKILPYNKKFWARPMPVPIHFLEPIPTEGLTLENVAELKQRVHNIMETYYVANKKA